jgi:ATP-dependent protease ClpP protease subunit
MFDVTTREIFLYDDIGPAYMGMFGTETLMEGIQTFGKGPINLRINSSGGSVDEALAMIEMLSRHNGEVHVSVDSIAASAASLFAAYFPSSAAPHARIMIHNPWGVAMGDAEEFRKQADILDIYRDSLITIYEEAMGQDRDAIIALLDAETWYTAKDALAAGLVDEIGGKGAETKPVPANRFKNVPQDLAVSPVQEPIAALVTEPEELDEEAKVQATKELTNKLELLRLKCKLHKAI